MILLIDTSAAICKLSLIDGDWRFDDQWQADRNLAKGLLKYFDDTLKSQGKNWSDISAIGVFEGPGSFTGLRIGLTVANTISNARGIPIVGARDGDWQNAVITKIISGINEKIVLPFYGGEAHITKPRK
jgi:tRNA threonylcarbamoyladenosine biosynthesis protein TsaB